MVGRVKVSVDELSTTAVKANDVVLTPGQARSFDLDKALTVEASEVPLPESKPGGPDVFDHSNPNGITSAAIGPKVPKPGGETEVVEGDNGRLVERSIGDDPAKARQAGGPDSGRSGLTPGPTVASAGAVAPGRDASATGDVDAAGRPGADPVKTAHGHAAAKKK